MHLTFVHIAKFASNIDSFFSLAWFLVYFPLTSISFFSLAILVNQLLLGILQTILAQGEQNKIKRQDRVWPKFLLGFFAVFIHGLPNDCEIQFLFGYTILKEWNNFRFLIMMGHHYLNDSKIQCIQLTLIENLGKWLMLLK